MYKGKTVLGVTLARGGSKSIPKKNIVDIAGKPLIKYTFDEVNKGNILDEYVVSTDDTEIAIISKKYGVNVPFERPKNLSEDTTTSADALIHCVEWFKKLGVNFDYVAELMATNPLKNYSDMEACIKKAIDFDADSCVAVHKLEDHHPSRIKYIENGYLKNFYPEVLESRRQDLKPDAYIRSGSIYVTRTDFLLTQKSRYSASNALAHILPSNRVINIDTPEDLALARVVLSENN